MKRSNLLTRKPTHPSQKPSPSFSPPDHSSFPTNPSSTKPDLLQKPSPLMTQTRTQTQNLVSEKRARREVQDEPRDEQNEPVENTANFD